MSIRQDIMREDVATLAEIEGKCRELNAALAASCRIQASGADNKLPNLTPRQRGSDLELMRYSAASCRIQASGAESKPPSLTPRQRGMDLESNAPAVDTAYDIAQKKLELARCEKILNITVEELKRLLVPDPATPWTMFVCEALGYAVFVTDDGTLCYIDDLPEKHPGEAATAGEYSKLRPLYELPRRWRERVIFYIRREARHAAVRNLLQSTI